jgi:Zn-dependent protease with chaperone function
MDAQPQLWSFVREIASHLGATPPSNIVIGLAPNFYVTSADVTVYPERRKQLNETLYLSLPLMRILSRQELTAVIGHELGHFKGDDTKFSLKFYPIYAGTTQALAALESRAEDGARSLESVRRLYEGLQSLLSIKRMSFGSCIRRIVIFYGAVCPS